MKKNIIALIVCYTLTTLPAVAQLTNERHHLTMGVNGGINMCSVSFSPSIKQNTFMGKTGGLTFRYISEKYFKMFCGIQAEINYSQRGWSELIEDDTEDSYSRSMNYIEVPLMAHLAFGKDSQKKGCQFFINLGPQFAYFMNEKEEMNEGFSKEQRLIDYQYGKMVENKFDYGIVVGAGVDFATGIGHFLVEGRYYYGLGDFWKNSKKDEFARSGHSYFGARIAYLINIGK